VVSTLTPNGRSARHSPPNPIWSGLASIIPAGRPQGKPGALPGPKTRIPHRCCRRRGAGPGQERVWAWPSRRAWNAPPRRSSPRTWYDSDPELTLAGNQRKVSGPAAELPPPRLAGSHSCSTSPPRELGSERRQAARPGTHRRIPRGRAPHDSTTVSPHLPAARTTVRHRTNRDP
jgi:hypothetical protein